MSEKGRAALAKIFSTTEYKDWAKRPGSVTDAKKIALEFGPPSVRRPTCGTRYGQGFQDLCRENPSQPVPPPPSPLADVWKLDAAFTNGGLSNFAGEPRARAFALGWRAVYVQLMHTVYSEANAAEMSVFKAQGWTLVGWGTYGQGSDPEQDGRDAAALCKQYGLKGWKANGEAWAEAQYFWKTDAFKKGWDAAGAPCPLGWSVLSSDTANFAREYDYPTALSVPGADIDLQVYGATVPTYTVGAGLGMLSKVTPTPVPVNRTTMSFDVNGDGNGPFPDYKTWTGPRRLWQPDRATVETFDRLAR